MYFEAQSWYVWIFESLVWAEFVFHIEKFKLSFIFRGCIALFLFVLVRSSCSSSFFFSKSSHACREIWKSSQKKNKVWQEKGRGSKRRKLSSSSFVLNYERGATLISTSSYLKVVLHISAPRMCGTYLEWWWLWRGLLTLRERGAPHFFFLKCLESCGKFPLFCNFDTRQQRRGEKQREVNVAPVIMKCHFPLPCSLLITH